MVERMMTGALRADGQRRMIVGDTMKETRQVRRHARINPFHVANSLPKFRVPGRSDLHLADPLSFHSHRNHLKSVIVSPQPGRGPHTHQNGRRSIIIKFRLTTIQCDNHTVAMAQECDLCQCSIIDVPGDS